MRKVTDRPRPEEMARTVSKWQSIGSVWGKTEVPSQGCTKRKKNVSPIDGEAVSLRFEAREKWNTWLLAWKVAGFTCQGCQRFPDAKRGCRLGSRKKRGTSVSNFKKWILSVGVMILEANFLQSVQMRPNLVDTQFSGFLSPKKRKRSQPLVCYSLPANWKSIEPTRCWGT